MNARIVISGASGLIGSALVAALEESGHPVTRLVRRATRAPDEVCWSPGTPLAPEVLAGTRAVVALGGASVGRLPWTRRYRGELLRSRIEGTRTIATAVRELGAEAPALISASAVGYYGSAPGKILTEASPAGETFLAGVCTAWEAEALRAGPHARVALLRTAPVIDRAGMLGPLIRLTQLGAGGPIGRGTQVWPWISLEDEVRAILHVIAAGLEGPVNLTGPAPATANELGRALARRLHRPFWLPAPEWALKLGLGRAAVESLLTSDADVRPRALERSGFVFSQPTVEAAIAAAFDGPDGTA